MDSAIPIGPEQDPLLRGVPTMEGFKVLGKTLLQQRVGAGGMGIVYRGFHLVYRLEVAVKIMKPSLTDHRDFAMRFRSEAEAALKITHQHIVRVYDVEERHGLRFLVMEFVDGETGRQRVHRRGPLPYQAVVTMMNGVAAGLAEAHGHGLVHGDVKPDNLLISRAGRVKLADLGLVRPAVAAAGESAADAPAGILGSPRYMPPEQWRSPHVTAAADIWALGASVYYLLTGKHVVPAMAKGQIGAWLREHPLPTLRQEIDAPDAFHDLFERCVERDPTARYRDGAELQRAVAALGIYDEGLLRLTDGDQPPRGPGVSPIPTAEQLGRIQRRLENPVADPRHRRSGRRSDRGSRPIRIAPEPRLVRPEPTGRVVRAERPLRGERAARRGGGAWSPLAVALWTAGVVLVVCLILLRSCNAAAAPATALAGESPVVASPALPEAATTNGLPRSGPVAPPAVVAVPLRLEVQSPANDATVPDGAIVLRGIVQGADAVAVVGRENAVAIDGENWTWTGPVAAGDVILRVVASGNGRSVERWLTVHVRPPPAPPAFIVSDDSFARPTVRGMAPGAKWVEARLGESQQRLAVEGDHFELAITDEQVGMELVATAVGERGLQSEPAKAWIRDLLPAPQVTWLEPRIGVPIEGEVTAKVQIRNPFAVTSVRLHVAQLHEELPDAGTEAICVEPASYGLSVWAASIVLAGSRPTAIEVVATDVGGRTNAAVPPALIGGSLIGADLPTTIGILMKPIAPGSFAMGNPGDGERRRVRITKAGWMGETEVSRSQWCALGLTLPVALAAVPADREPPVALVTFADAMVFCERLTVRERAAGRLPDGYAYTLPTEAFWEFACRAGTDGAYAIDGFQQPRSSVPVPVGQGPANAWGLRNMHGNVAELCSDRSPVKPQDEDDPDRSGMPEKTYRGGAWTDSPQNVASYSRRPIGPDQAKKRIGFRVASLPVRT